MIKLNNISKRFDKNSVLKNINLEIKDGEKVLITGQNGAGKSTLLKIILGEIIPNSGQVFVNNINPFKDRKKALFHIAFTPQLPPPLKLNLKDICFYAAKTTGSEQKKIDSFAKILNFDLEKEFKKPFYKLSGGMKQKFLIALALARDTEILIFDEPTANLDTVSREIFLNLIKEKFSKNTIITISHRIDEVKNITTKIIEMDLGEICSQKEIE